MKTLSAVLGWFKTNGVIIAVGTIVGCVIAVSVMAYRFVDEVLSIAQRGYFFSVPVGDAASRGNKTLEKKLQRKLIKELDE